MIDAQLPKLPRKARRKAQTSGYRQPHRAAWAVGGLPHVSTRRMIAVQEPASGECRNPYCSKYETAAVRREACRSGPSSRWLPRSLLRLSRRYVKWCISAKSVAVPGRSRFALFALDQLGAHRTPAARQLGADGQCRDRGIAVAAPRTASGDLCLSADLRHHGYDPFLAAFTAGELALRWIYRDGMSFSSHRGPHRRGSPSPAGAPSWYAAGRSPHTWSWSRLPSGNPRRARTCGRSS
jgi:hypothetical protein